MNDNIKIKPTDSLRKALKNLYKSGLRCLVVVDAKGYLEGTLSDGDVRAAIIKGAKLQDKVEGLYNKIKTTISKKTNRKNITNL